MKGVAAATGTRIYHGDKMLIENVEIAPIADDRIEVGATYLGRPLYYRLPAERFCKQAVGDALLLSTLAPAMRNGTTLKIPLEFPVSARLMSRLDAIQRIWMGWNAKLKKVAVEAAWYEPHSATGGVGLFYAGGVDSSYSLYSRLDEIEAMICCYGFDFTFSEAEIQESIDRNGRLAQALGKQLVPVEANHSQFARHLGVSRVFGYAASFASIAHLLGLRRCYIASSHSVANMRPDGSHPILDSMFSNGITEIVHDEPVSRLEKTWAVAKDPVLLDNLRVCWNYHHRNCGACSKCVRTMTALRLIGVDGPFPPLQNMRQLRDMAAETEIEYAVELVLAAHAKGDHAMVRELKRGLRRNDRKAAIQAIDRAFFGGRLVSLFRRVADPEINLIKANLRPDLEIS